MDKKINLVMTSWPKTLERISYIHRTMNSLNKLLAPGFQFKKLLCCEAAQVSKEKRQMVEYLGWPVRWRDAQPSLGMHFNEIFSELEGLVMLIEDDCMLGLRLNIVPGISLIQEGKFDMVRYWTDNNNLLVKEGKKFTSDYDNFVSLPKCKPEQFQERQVYSDRPFLAKTDIWKRIGPYKAFAQHEFDMDWRFKEFKVPVAVRMPSAFWHIGIDTLYKGKVWSDTYDVRRNQIEGMMSDEELLWLFNMALQMDSVVEIGSWMGRSTHALLSGCKGSVYSVDHFMGSADPIETGHRNVFSDFYDNVGQFKNLKILRVDSLAAAGVIEDKSIDFAFIDGGHMYEEAKADIKAWLPKAKKLIAVHDCDSPPVAKAIEEVLGKGQVWERIWYKFL
jgi:hypothetical protein